jgi:hypothetical protein
MLTADGEEDHILWLTFFNDPYNNPDITVMKCHAVVPS